MSGDPLNSPSSRGHLIIKSHSPFPRFRCAVPVPPPTSLIFQLRNTVLAILTGQTNTESSTINNESTGLSYSEHLKQQTLHEWRLKGIILELRQNALIAPETRDRMEDENQDQQESKGKGFVLLDEHECALLEHGDEINIWLRDGQEIESLRLPKLSSKHTYGLPNQPSLTRSGTILGPPPSYSSIQQEYEFSAPNVNLIEPAEPSSHSSSVSAHPNGQYETTMRHKSTPAGWHRVLYLNNQSNNEQSTNGNNGGLSSAVKTGKRTKPRRLNSEGSNALLDQLPKPIRRYSSNVHNQSRSDSERKEENGKSPIHSPPTSPSLSNKEILMSQTIAESGPSKAIRSEREKIRKAGQRAMPSQALVIGPGVQGKVGRLGGGGGESTNETSAESGEYGNMEAFVSFTAASSEVHQNRKTSNNGPLSSRRMSSRSGTSDKQERATKLIDSAARRSGEAQNDSNGKASGTSMSSALGTTNQDKKNKIPIIKRYVKLPQRPELPPIRNLMPFQKEENESEKVETLISMPMPSPIAIQPPSADDVTPNSTQSQREIQLAQDAALARALSESLNADPLAENKSNSPIEAQKVSKLVRRQTTDESVKSSKPTSLHRHLSGSELNLFSGNSKKGKESPGLVNEEVQQQLSKAEKRYNEVKKSLEAEKTRQSEQEKVRKERVKKEEEERQKVLQKIEQERRQKEEKLRWQVWDEVRSRQAKEQAR